MTTELDTLRPNYYKGNEKIEVWDFVISQNLGFLDGNIVKYVCRYKEKNGLEDLKKARQYLDKLISLNEQENVKNDENNTKDNSDLIKYIKIKIKQADKWLEILKNQQEEEGTDANTSKTITWWNGQKIALEDCLRVYDNHKE